MEVDWFPRSFFKLTITLSPTSASMRGRGHWPLIPMVVLSNWPSGLAVTHPVVKLYTRVAADAEENQNAKHRKRKLDKESTMMSLFLLGKSDKTFNEDVLGEMRGGLDYQDQIRSFDLESFPKVISTKFSNPTGKHELSLPREHEPSDSAPMCDPAADRMIRLSRNLPRSGDIENFSYCSSISSVGRH